MNKKVFLLIAAAVFLSTGAYAANPPPLPTPQPTPGAQPAPGVQPAPGTLSAEAAKPAEPKNIDTKTMYYPNATVPSGIQKYKKGNYTGCLQEMLSVVKKDPKNAMGHYYLGLAYMKINDNTAATSAFDKVIATSSNFALVQYAAKAKKCASGMEACKPSGEEQELDTFITNAYGNPNNYGAKPAAPASSKQASQQELDALRQKMNSQDYLYQKDLQQIRNLNKSEEITGERIAAASDEEILQAIKTLKDAGVTITVNNPSSYTPDQQAMQMMQQMQMLNGGQNNNNPMMNMLPYMYAQNDSGKNIDPQVMQSFIMNSMIPDFGFNNNNNNR